MSGKRKVHHPNDVTNVYFSELIPEILHKYFRLPGKFVRNFTTRIVKRDGSEGEMDWLMLVEPDNCRLYERILINVEFQSSKVTEEKIEIFSEYKDYAKIYYGLPVLTVVIITDGFESSKRQYSRVSSDILKPVYVHISWGEITKRLKKIGEKIDNQIKLTEDDGLDMVYLPMFSPKNKAEKVLERILQLFERDMSLKGLFRNHVAFGLSIMVTKYFGQTPKMDELLDMLERTAENDRLRMVAEYVDDFERQRLKRKLADKEREIEAINSRKDAEIESLKAKLEANGIAY